ncbi:MAG: aminotransferase class IV [Polyangiaceae bacterium]|nr:aminotransferase class IV [Polyangiaceae bacterium]
MSRLACVDGEILGPDQARVSVYDRGFLYGDSVFETIRTYGGKPFALDEHVRRLERSSELVGIQLPVEPSVLAAEIERSIFAAGNAECYVRVMITRGTGPLGLDPAHVMRPLRVILVEPLTPLPAAMYRDGVSVITYRTERASDAAHGAKVGNYLSGMLALRVARQTGAHEALILDTKGRVTEGTTSNVFIVRGQTIVTPPDDAGILLGITRAKIIEIAPQIGLSVDYSLLVPADLATADEVFLSSSMREILPVVRVDGVPVGNAKPGPTTRALHTAFRKMVGLENAPLPWEG